MQRKEKKNSLFTIKIKCLSATNNILERCLWSELIKLFHIALHILELGSKTYIGLHLGLPTSYYSNTLSTNGRKENQNFQLYSGPRHIKTNEIEKT